MMFRKIYIVFFVLFCGALGAVDAGHAPPFFIQKGSISRSNREKIGKYLLSSDDKLINVLNKIFINPAVVRNNATFSKAGFDIFCPEQPYSYLRVARHPKVPGYVFKFYPEEEKRLRRDKISNNILPSWKWLLRRCENVEELSAFLKKKNIKLFVTPQKWLYRIPTDKKHLLRHPILLVAEDMNIVSLKESYHAWKTKVTRRHLDELYQILRHGYASCYLPGNLPYIKDGVFTCIDTEHPRRERDLRRVKKFFSKKMARYWDHLIKTDGKK